MAAEKLNCMNEAAVEGAGPPHSRRSHASLRRQLREKSRRSHDPMMGVFVRWAHADSVEVVVRVVAGVEPGAAAVGRRGGRSIIRAEIEERHVIIQAAAASADIIRRGQMRRRRRIRHLMMVMMVEAHLWIFLSHRMVQTQERERTVGIHGDALDRSQAVGFRFSMIDVVVVEGGALIRVLWLLRSSSAAAAAIEGLAELELFDCWVGQGEVSEGALGFGGEKIQARIQRAEDS